MPSLGENGPPTSIHPASEFTIEYDDLRNVEVIAEGGNAVVRRAIIETAEGGRTVGIKQPKFSGTINVDKTEKFVSEAKIWSKLDDNQHIVSVYDWEANPIPWIAMEYADRGSLKEITSDSRLPPKQALWVIYCICKAVLHAHRNGVAHHDLKPANVLFYSIENYWDVPKVSDWGLAQILIDETEGIDGLTPQYSAPEQFAPSQFGSPDDMTDVYQVGVLAYELITGRPPFTGDANTVKEKILQNEIVPPSELVNVPAVVDNAIMSALYKNKADRYDTIAYFRDNIKKILKNVLPEEESIDISTKNSFSDTLVGTQNETEATDKNYNNSNDRADKSYDFLRSRRTLMGMLLSGVAVGGGLYLSPRLNKVLNSNSLTEDVESIRLEQLFSNDFNQGGRIHSFAYDNELYFVGNSLLNVDLSAQTKREIITLQNDEEAAVFDQSGDDLYIGTGGTFNVDGIGKIIKIDLEGESVEWSYNTPGPFDQVRWIGASEDRVLAISNKSGTGDSIAPRLFILSNDGNILKAFDFNDSAIIGDILTLDDMALIGQVDSSKLIEFSGNTVARASDVFGDSFGAHLTERDNTIYAVREKLAKIDLNTNNIEYQKSALGTSFNRPTLSGESVVVGGTSGLHSYNTRTGEQQMHIRTTDTVFNRPVTIGNYAFVFDGSGNLFGANIKNGELVYDYRPFDRTGAKLFVFDNTLIAYDTGSMTQFEPIAISE